MADKPEQDKKELKTLTDDDIVAEAPVNRRSALGLLGGLAIGSTMAAVLAQPSEAQALVCRRRTGRSDSDSGPNGDSPGCGHTGVTDSDPSDSPGYGRGGRRVRRRTGVTDRDGGPGADGAGYGVCPGRGHTDSDSGGGSDPAGRGRGPCH